MIVTHIIDLDIYSKTHQDVFSHSTKTRWSKITNKFAVFQFSLAITARRKKNTRYICGTYKAMSNYAGVGEGLVIKIETLLVVVCVRCDVRQDACVNRTSDLLKLLKMRFCFVMVK